jgi:hypothetical protein
MIFLSYSKSPAYGNLLDLIIPVIFSGYKLRNYSLCNVLHPYYFIPFVSNFFHHPVPKQFSHIYLRFDAVHHSIFCIKRRFGDWTLPPLRLDHICSSDTLLLSIVVFSCSTKFKIHCLSLSSVLLALHVFVRMFRIIHWHSDVRV